MPESIIDLASLPDKFGLRDHLGGFDKGNRNLVLDRINDYAQAKNKYYDIYYHNVLPQTVYESYSNLNLHFSSELQQTESFSHFSDFEPTNTLKDFKNFVCSFNGSEHVARQLLTSALYKFGWFDSNYSTKNFHTSVDQIDGNIIAQFDSEVDERFYRKFILANGNTADIFYQSIYTMDYARFDHKHNLNILLDKINQSFVQIVSETMATSYVPFVTEKFLYPVIGKSLWVGYSQPGWHKHLSDIYGFKLYTVLFNYNFDSIINPIVRLVELMEMLSKFSCLTPDEWHDLYLLEADTIEFNYDWYMSKQYLIQLEKFDG